MTAPRILFAAALVCVTSCKPDSQASPDRVVAAAPVDAGSGPTAVVVYGRVAVREKPDDKARAVTLLSYGERVSVVEPGESWTHIRLSDGTLGHAQTKMLLVGNVTEGTLTQETAMYVRPDFRSTELKRVQPGLYMFELADMNGYRQVQLPDRSRGWIHRQKWVTEEPELALALAMHRAEVFQEAKKPADALRVLQEALGAYPNARLAPMVQTRIAALLPPDGGPASVTTTDAGAAPAPAPAPTPDAATP